MPVFFIEESQVDKGSVRITEPLNNHLQGSLRVKSGDEIDLVVPRQCRYRVRVERCDSNALVGVIVDEQTYPCSQWPQIILGQALLKGDRMDWLIQKASELGASEIMPLVTRQSVVRPRDDRVQTQRERWDRIALEAAQQAERWESPPVAAPIPADRFFCAHRPADVGLILSERTNGQSLTTVRLPTAENHRVVIAVGPEGGWRPEEIGAAVECGFVPVTLGSKILRAETAGLAAITILQSRLGALG